MYRFADRREWFELYALLGELEVLANNGAAALEYYDKAEQMGRPERGGTFIPLSLSRQELADMTGTTIETCIRIMSRWSKEEIVRTEKDGFVVLSGSELEAMAME